LGSQEREQRESVSRFVQRQDTSSTRWKRWLNSISGYHGDNRSSARPWPAAREPHSVIGATRPAQRVLTGRAEVRQCSSACRAPGLWSGGRGCNSRHCSQRAWGRKPLVGSNPTPLSASGSKKAVGGRTSRLTGVLVKARLVPRVRSTRRRPEARGSSPRRQRGTAVRTGRRPRRKRLCLGRPVLNAPVGTDLSGAPRCSVWWADGPPPEGRDHWRLGDRVMG
jgi:hypothetical protein